MTRKSFLIDTRDPAALDRFEFRIVPKPTCWQTFGLSWQMKSYTDERGYLAFGMHLRIGDGEWKLATFEEMDALHGHCEGDECRVPKPKQVS